MDLLTQALAGALTASLAANRGQVRPAALAGLAAGLAADADALIRSADDPLLNLEFHRHFTHALVFVPLGGLAVALLLLPLLGRRMGFARLLTAAVAGYAPSGLLDACTSYGTHLFWPFSSERVAWNLIAIVDPLFTAVLLMGVVLAVWARRSFPALVALALAVAYLGLGAVQHGRAQTEVARWVQERGHEPRRGLVKPTLGNLVLWRSVYEADGRFFVDAVRVGLGGPPRRYPGGSVPVFRLEEAGIPADSRLSRDVARFARFSDGYLALAPARPHVLADVRYAIRPNGLEPLWGIGVDPDHPDAPAQFLTFRRADPEDRQAFLEMLLGRD